MTAVRAKRNVGAGRKVRLDRKPRGQGHERLAEILKAAKELFLAEGYEKVSTRQLAQHAGLSQTGLYLYFKSKEEIHRALCSQTFEELTKRWQRVVHQARGPEQMLRRAAEAYIAFGIEHPDEYQITFMQRRPSGAHKIKDIFHPLRRSGPGVRAFLAWREIVQSAMEAGFIKPMDVTAATLMTWLPLHGFVASWIALPDFPWPPKQQVVDSLIDTVLAGLRVRK